MAGQIIISNIKTDSDNAFSILANTGAVLFSANLASGITTGIADGSVTNAKLAGSITGDKIATGQITGNLIATNAISQNNIVSVNASVATVGTLPKARLPSGSILQVVSTTKTDTFTTTSGSYVDVTGLSVSITPTSATSNVFVLFQINGSQDVGSGRASLKLLRGSTVINAGDAAGSRTPALGGFSSSDQSIPSTPVSGSFLDSPATTSSTTYKIQLAMTAGSGTAYINRTDQDADNADQIRMASTITVMEIAA
jgi:hypothetical protein